MVGGLVTLSPFRLVSGSGEQSLPKSVGPRTVGHVSHVSVL